MTTHDWEPLPDPRDQKMAELTAQRDELLAALQLCYRYVNGGRGLYPSLHHDAFTAARAAFERCNSKPEAK